MKAADINRAQTLLDERATAQRLRDRLAAGERIALSVGTGSDKAEIELADSYQQDLRRDFAAALEAKIAAHECALRDLGVEP